MKILSIAVIASFLIHIALLSAIFNIKNDIKKSTIVNLYLISEVSKKPTGIIREEASESVEKKVAKRKQIERKEEVIKDEIKSDDSKTVVTEELSDTSSEVDESENELADNNLGTQTSDIDSGSKAVESEYIKESYTYIQKKIKENVNYPATAKKMGQKGKIEVKFTVNFDGTVSDIVIVVSSGYKLLDSAAITAIETAAPFTAPPKSITLIIPIDFKMM